MEEIKNTYYNNGQRHSERYYIDGKLHREDGPAYIEYYKNGQMWKEWYSKNNVPHRENGPAFIRYCEDGKIETKSYYINGEEITDEFKILVIETLEK